MKPSQARPFQQGSLPHARSLSGTGLAAALGGPGVQHKRFLLFRCAHSSLRGRHTKQRMYINVAV